MCEETCDTSRVSGTLIPKRYVGPLQLVHYALVHYALAKPSRVTTGCPGRGFRTRTGFENVVLSLLLLPHLLSPRDPRSTKPPPRRSSGRRRARALRRWSRRRRRISSHLDIIQNRNLGRELNIIGGVLLVRRSDSTLIGNLQVGRRK